MINCVRIIRVGEKHQAISWKKSFKLSVIVILSFLTIICRERKLFFFLINFQLLIVYLTP